MKAGRKWVVALVLLLVTGGSAFALGLGQIKVKSALNQPLEAIIPIVSATPDELAKLEVSLASSADYQRVGIDRSRLQVPLTFKVEERAQGYVIVVTSEEPVGNPALDLLLELEWSRGKLLREYSVLLSPPGMPAPQASAPVVAAADSSQPAETTPAPVAPAPEPEATTASAEEPETAPVSTESAAETVATTTPAAAAAPVSTAATSGSELAPGSNYTVAAGDTTWEIAERSTSPGNVNRMMLAIQRANPDAFYEDNINALKTGAVLRIPTREELTAIGGSEARNAVRRQNEVWSNAGTVSPSTMASTGSASSFDSAASNQGASSSRLQLVPPDSDTASGAGRTGVAGGEGDVDVSALNQDLARAREALASEKQKSADLQSRVTELESIHENNQRLLDLKNAQIAELQAKLESAGEAQPAVAPAGEALADTAAVTSEPADTDSAEPAAAASAEALEEDIFAADTAATTSAMAPAAAGSAMANADAAEQAEAASTAPAATEAAATLAGTGEADAGTTTEATEPETSPAANEPATAAAKPWYMRLWVWIVGTIILLILLFLGMRGRRSGGDASMADDPDGGGIVDADEDEAMLREQLADDPDNMTAHLELASLYYAYRDEDKFIAAAEAMHAHVEDDDSREWDQVRAMGEELCPDHPLFAGLHSDGDDAIAGLHDDDDAFADTGFDDDDGELPGLTDDDGGEEVSLAGMVEGTEISRDDSGYNFDFDLTGPDGDDGKTEDDGLGVSGTADADATVLDDGAATDVDDDPFGLGDLSPDSDDSDVPAVPLVDEGDTTLDLAAEPPAEPESDAVVDDDGGFSSDPVDTKLDLARAYQDMGDSEGARAMLEEVMQEGSQSQKDAARKLLDDLDN